MSAIAMHEAAHCVLAHRHGIRVESVSIAPWEDSAGRMIAHLDEAPPEAAIKAVYAGFLVGMRIAQRDGPRPDLDVNGSNTDFEIARSIAVKAWGADADRRLGELMTAALIEIDAEWLRIERLARALVECPYLNELEISRLLAA